MVFKPWYDTTAIDRSQPHHSLHSCMLSIDFYPDHHEITRDAPPEHRLRSSFLWIFSWLQGLDVGSYVAVPGSVST